MIKIIKRILFLILLFPFIFVCVVIMILSLVSWIGTGRDLFFIIDYLKIQMEKLLR